MTVCVVMEPTKIGDRMTDHAILLETGFDKAAFHQDILCQMGFNAAGDFAFFAAVQTCTVSAETAEKKVAAGYVVIDDRKIECGSGKCASSESVALADAPSFIMPDKKAMQSQKWLLNDDHDIVKYIDKSGVTYTENLAGGFTSTWNVKTAKEATVYMPFDKLAKYKMALAVIPFGTEITRCFGVLLNDLLQEVEARAMPSQTGQGVAFRKQEIAFLGNMLSGTYKNIGKAYEEYNALRLRRTA